MLSFLQSIIDFFAMLGSFLGNVISSLFQLITLLPKALIFVQSAIGFVPSAILTFIIAGVGLSLVFMIVGRSS